MGALLAVTSPESVRALSSSSVSIALRMSGEFVDMVSRHGGEHERRTAR